MSERNIASSILLKRLYKTKEKLDNRIKKTTEHTEKLNKKISSTKLDGKFILIIPE